MKHISNLLLLFVLLGTSCQGPKSIPQEPKTLENPLDLQIQQIISTLSPGEKIGQVLIIGLRPPLYQHTVTKIDPQVRKALLKIQPGGIAFFKGNFLNASQTKQLIMDLNEPLKLPAFMAVDEEGGLVSRLGSNPLMKVPRLPEAKTLGLKGGAEVEGRYEKLSVAMKNLGLNMNLAPVGDGDFLDGNPIGNRAFSTLVEDVSKFSLAAIRGIQKAQVSAVIKHFPGLGSVSVDPHKGMPVLGIEASILEARDFLPFQEAATQGVDGIMAAHVILPKVTGSNTPAGFSSKLLKGVIRDTWNYQGLIISDGLEMAAVTSRWSPGEAAILALEAGSDMLLLPIEPEKVKLAIQKALDSGRLKWADLDQSLARILRIKILRGIIPGK